METTKRKRTREEVRAAFREYLDDKKKRMEEKQRELEEIHEMRMSGMTMEDNGRDLCIVVHLKSFYYEHTQIKRH